MKILIDTHILLWAIYSPEKLSDEHRFELETQANTIFVSSISIAEIMIKASIGKIILNSDLIQATKESQFEFLDFSPEAAVLLKELPYHHKDPFDRMLIVQAMSHNCHFMTVDEKIKMYEPLSVI